MASEEETQHPEKSSNGAGDIETGEVKETSVVKATSVIPEVDPRVGLTTAEVEAGREKFGWNEIPAPVTPLWVLFLRQFMGFLPLLIELAAIVSLGVQDYADFGIIFSILFINACLGFREEYHAKKALDELSNSFESEITVVRDGSSKDVLNKELVPGDICLLVGGNIVPADIKWLQGDVMMLDTAALTGEPLPRKYPSGDYGDVMLCGTTVRQGECYGRVMATGTHTEMGQAQADLLQDKSVRIVSVFQQKITTVVKILISSSLIVVLAVILVQGFVYHGFDNKVRNTILDALGILISAIPVALPLVIQVNLALGAAFLAKKHNAIVTSIPALQDIASMSILCSDKTGTLTTAKMSIISDSIYSGDGFTEIDVVKYAYLASNADKKEDPIDRAIVVAFHDSPEAEKAAEGYNQDYMIGFNPEVKRVVAFVSTPDGNTITIAKGLPAKIIDTEAGHKDDHEIQWKVDKYKDKTFLKTVTERDRELSSSGYKTIGIAVCDGDARNEENAVWKFVGLLPMLDPPRADTARTIQSLHNANISVKMITGDHVNVGRETARLIGLGTDIKPGEDIRSAQNEEIKKQMIWEADGFAAVLISDKREVVLTLHNDYGVVTGMTGDGANDAAALSAAQVGIAVQGATDAAKNAADLILTEPGLAPIYGAVLESRRIFARIKSYVVYRIAASIILVCTLSIIIFAEGCAVDSLLVIILALLNDISMIPVAYDRALATARPQLPIAKKLVLMSGFYGVMHAAFGLIFIFSLNQGKPFKEGDNLDLHSCNQSTQGFIWLHLVLVTELAIFSARAPGLFFKSIPSVWLLVSVLGTCLVGTFVARYARDVPWSSVGWVWLFNVAAFCVVDLFKIKFRELIGDAPGPTIDSDEPVEFDSTKTEDAKFMEKKLRYAVHTESARPAHELTHSIEIITNDNNDMIGMFVSQLGELRPVRITDGFVQKQRARSTSFPPPSHSYAG